MIEVKKEGVLLRKTGLDFENEGVLNPAVISDGDHIHLFYRAVSKGNYSTIGYCKLKEPLAIEERLNKPLFSREYAYESHGMEDPRITKIDDLYYLSYTAYDGVNALGALAESTISYLLVRLTVNAKYPDRIRGWQNSDTRGGFLVNNRKAISLRLA
jgi:predicted GH43/DUF377 family glycosyl hydrolase